MQVNQRIFKKSEWWSNEDIKTNIQLVLAFSSPNLMKKDNIYNSLKKFYPNAEIVIVSTAWEIYNTEVYDETVSVNAFYFEKTKIKVVSKELKDIKDSFNIAQNLVKEINKEDLKYTLIFQDWLWINPEYFLGWIKSILSKNVWITWWLAWNISDPQKTYVSHNNKATEKNIAVLVAFYGESINIWNASFAWFDTFWIERIITKSKENIVYEVDWEPILDLYKKYLWEKSKELPASWVYFPISIYKENKKNWIIRSILTIDEKVWSITFSGNVPQWYKASLMKTNYSKLINKAWKAAELSLKQNSNPQFALLISCVGRRIILKQRTEEEIEEIRYILWEKVKIWGFYSYWEIWINWDTFDYELHNQTMTIALFSEK